MCRRKKFLLCVCVCVCEHIFRLICLLRKKSAIFSRLLSFQVNVLEPHPNLPYLATSGLDDEVKLWLPTGPEEEEIDRKTVEKVRGGGREGKEKEKTRQQQRKSNMMESFRPEPIQVSQYPPNCEDLSGRQHMPTNRESTDFLLTKSLRPCVCLWWERGKLRDARDLFVGGGGGGGGGDAIPKLSPVCSVECDLCLKSAPPPALQKVISNHLATFH